MDLSVFNKCVISDEIAQECYDFARNSTDNYDKRGQSDRRKKIWDIFLGKLGEWVAYSMLLPFFADLTKPDMRIYEVHGKSWSPDICAGELDIAVKTCCNGKFAGSWVTQLSDGNGHARDLAFYGEKGNKTLAVFVHMYIKMPEISEKLERPIVGSIRSIIPVPELHRWQMFGEMKLEKFDGKKEAIYYGALTCFKYGPNRINPEIIAFIEKVQG